MGTQKKHDYATRNEEGIEQCKFCAAQRKIVNSSRKYRPRKTTEWTRKATACERPHGVNEQIPTRRFHLQDPKACQPRQTRST